jgi:hypothetical protein
MSLTVSTVHVRQTKRDQGPDGLVHDVTSRIFSYLEAAFRSHCKFRTCNATITDNTRKDTTIIRGKTRKSQRKRGVGAITILR